MALPERVPESPEAPRPAAVARPSDTTRRLILAQLWVAILAFGIAAAMAVMQAISRANLELPYRTPRMYYMHVHGQGTPADLVADRSTLTGQHLAEYVGLSV